MNVKLSMELISRGFSYSNGNVVALHSNRIFSFEEFLQEIDIVEKSYKENIRVCWDEIFKTSDHKLYSGKCDKLLYSIVSNIYIKIQRRISNKFYGKNEQKICNNINLVFSENSIGKFNNTKSDIIIKNFSSILKSEVGLYNLYIIKIITEKLHKENFEIKKVSYNRGISGPWANLDLPMEERVFTWRDVEEETTERQTDKQKQRRYTMGYEDEKEGFKEGFYFRELRNEPFLFENASFDSPYPYRSVLWSQP